ncbi:MAG: hypothetical protein PHU64_04175 [Candidatus Omnitrophica bacterium]|nr:hypothetical protein [Candidatus Omnitrophota bacterium]MDD5429257.1 hypothetical protein [Candidatus Omnitrophota bacterium]
MNILRVIFLFGLAAILTIPVFSQNSSGISGSPASSTKKSTSADSKITADGTAEKLPLIEVKRLEGDQPQYSIELRNAELADFFRLIAHDYDFNILVDERVEGEITASFTNLSLDDALENIANMYGLSLEKNKGVVVVKPNLITKTIAFKHINAESFLKGVAASSYTSGENPVSSQDSGDGSSTATANIYDLLSPIGKILLGRQRNIIMVIDYPDNVNKVENFIQAVDGRMTSRVFKLKYISSKEIIVEDQKEEEPEFTLGDTDTIGDAPTSGN